MRGLVEQGLVSETGMVGYEPELPTVQTLCSPRPLIFCVRERSSFFVHAATFSLEAWEAKKVQRAWTFCWCCCSGVTLSLIVDHCA